MAWHHRENGPTPLIPGLVYIRVANATVQDINKNIVVTDFPSFNAKGG